MQTQLSESSHLDGALRLDDLIKSKRFHWSEAVQLVAAIAEVVHLRLPQSEAYPGLTPSQILIDGQGAPRLAQLDRLNSESQPSAETTRPLEDYAYVAPECLGRGDAVSVQADVYSLGSILYQLLTDRLLFVARTPEDWTNQIRERLPRPPRTIDDRIPKPIEEVCLKCLNKDSAARYQSAAEFARELREFAKIASAIEVVKIHEKVDGGLKSWCVLLCTYWFAAVILLLILLSGLSVLAFRKTEDENRNSGLMASSFSSSEAGSHLRDATAKIEPRVPPIAVLTDWNKFATKTELGVVKSPVGEWVTTLNQPPKILLFPAMREQSSIGYRAQDQEVFVNTTELVLLELGETSESNYDLKVTIGQNAWEGGIGLFLGYQDAQDKGPDVKLCQFIFLSRADRGTDQLLGANLLSVFMTEQGVFRKIERNPILIPALLPSHEQVLLVEIRNCQLNAIRWGEQSGGLPDYAIRWTYRPTSFLGRFGLYYSKASGYLRKPQFRVVSKKP
jgi:serine/threonine protein kinase